jgi:hypothetical protein
MLARCTNTDGLTSGQLRTLFARRQNGEKTDALAEEVGKTGLVLRRAWRRIGLHASQLIKKRNETHCRSVWIYSMRVRGMSYYEIAEYLSMPQTKATRRTLYNRLVTHCKKFRLPFPKVKSKPTSSAQSAGSP